jgi:hypothetical protein
MVSFNANLSSCIRTLLLILKDVVFYQIMKTAVHELHVQEPFFSQLKGSDVFQL